MKSRAVVVGTTGNAVSTAVVDWAADEARYRRLPLRIVHILEWDSGQAPESGSGSYVERVWSAAAAATNATAARARDIAPGLEITADTLAGHPAGRLLELARDAELVVLGHRGSGGFAGLLLGSVSLRVAAHAPCPVAVVRGLPNRDGPISAGVDGSPATAQVLETAFAAAAARAARLVVVRAFAPAMQPWPAELKQAEAARLEEQLKSERQRFPGVPVEIQLTHRSITSVLVSASVDAQLVIVGSRGRGALRAALLGSTGRHVLQHAQCPVLVARPLC
ncbi:nucleotide-binding universal stress UspA family protein [Actinoplanes tereljensis]|uniref:Universal stress protein n=1 Tax=Paractinoplanes tereljensis TaxID=571912 RepID=A0A919NQQ9_9ACTN|nr:universal stress protein [Actinoplanes tereljensis]GIF23364.1 universal stress protein [Actinoplanes tereljensis]